MLKQKIIYWKNYNQFWESNSKGTDPIIWDNSTVEKKGGEKRSIERNTVNKNKQINSFCYTFFEKIAIVSIPMKSIIIFLEKN